MGKDDDIVVIVATVEKKDDNDSAKQEISTNAIDSDGAANGAPDAEKTSDL